MTTTNGKQMRLTPELWERLKKDGQFGEPLWRALERVFRREDTMRGVLFAASAHLRRHTPTSDVEVSKGAQFLLTAIIEALES